MRKLSLERFNNLFKATWKPGRASVQIQCWRLRGSALSHVASWREWLGLEGGGKGGAMKAFAVGGQHDWILYGRWIEWESDQTGELIVVHARDETRAGAESVSLERRLWYERHSVQFSCLVVSDSLRPHEPQHPRSPCPSPTPRVYPNPCPLSRWCHPTISSSVIPFCPQSFPVSGSFQMSQLFTSGGQSTGVSTSTSVLPMNTWDWSPLGWTGWISLQPKGLSRVFSNTTVQTFCWIL